MPTYKVKVTDSPGSKTHLVRVNGHTYTKGDLTHRVEGTGAGGTITIYSRYDVKKDNPLHKNIAPGELYNEVGSAAFTTVELADTYLLTALYQ